MKIALLTIWHVGNYGAELQAYATIKVLQKLGHDVKMINIQLSDRYPNTIKKRIINIIKHCTPYYFKFYKFWNKYIPTTDRYKSYQEIKDNPPEADAYIIGSDQVWNPQITGMSPQLFFLDFGDANIKRLSLASSFGQEDWLYPQFRNSITKLLSNFDLVTCREESGIKLLSQVFNINGKLLLDPTLMLNSYDELIGKTVEEQNTLVYYPLSEDQELSDFAISLARQNNMEVININDSKYLFGRILWNKPSIEQWLKNIASARFVITRSFHGLIFSILFNRNFAVLKGRNNRTTRLINLLNLLGLKERLYNDVVEMNNAAPWLKKIDYDNVNYRLQKLRAESYSIIQEIL